MRMTRLRALLLGTCLSFAPGVVAAIEFTSSFESIKIAARPGEVVSRSFELHLAPEGRRVHFRSRMEDWWQSEDGSQSFYRPPGTLSRSCGPWIELDPVETAVEPGGTLSVRVTAAIPREVTPGGYWCVLTVDELPDPLAVPRGGVEVRFLSSVSVGVFISIEPVSRAAEIRDVRIAAGEARIAVSNRGNAPLGVEGRIEFLRPGTRETVATAVIPRSTVLTEPVSSRTLTARLPAMPAGRYLVLVILDVGLDHYLGVQKELEIGDDLLRPPVPGR